MKSIIRYIALFLSILAFADLISLLLCTDVQFGTFQVPQWILQLFFLVIAGSAGALWFVAAESTQHSPISNPLKSGAKPKPEHLIEEYKLAQSSAEHHDKLLWSTSGLVWGASLILLGYVSKDHSLSNKGIPIVFVSLLGIALTIAVWWMTYIWNTVMGIKYKRCQQIEEELGLHQNIDLEKVYPKGRMKWLYAVVSIFFLWTWLTILLNNLCPQVP